MHVQTATFRCGEQSEESWEAASYEAIGLIGGYGESRSRCGGEFCGGGVCRRGGCGGAESEEQEEVEESAGSVEGIGGRV